MAEEIDSKGLSQRPVRMIITILALICFIGIFYYLFKKYHFSFHELFKVPISIMLLMVALVLLTFLVRGLIIKSLVKMFDVKLSFYEWYGLSIFRKYLNYLPLKSGTIAKGLYLKRCHNLPLALFISVLGGFFILFLLSNGVLGIICWSIGGKQGTNLEFVVPLAFAVFILVGLVFMFYSPPELSRRRGFFLTHLDRMYKGWRLIREDRNTVATVTFLSLMTTVIYSLKLLVLFRWQSVQVSFSQAIMISVLTNLVTIFINVTPSALGIKEAVLIYTSSLMGVGIEACLYVAAIDRIIAMMVTVVLGPMASYLFGKKLGGKVFEGPRAGT